VRSLGASGSAGAASPRTTRRLSGNLDDLAALELALESAAKFRELVLAAVAADVGLGGEKDPYNMI
jgi:hypothetical protein